MLRSARLAQLCRFAVVGGAATISYLVLSWAAMRLGSPASLASLVAYAPSALLSYHGHRVLTFGGVPRHGTAAPRFVALSLLSYAAAFAIPALLTDVLGVRPLVSFAVTTAAIPAMNYMALRRFVFAPRLGLP